MSQTYTCVSGTAVALASRIYPDDYSRVLLKTGDQFEIHTPDASGAALGKAPLLFELVFVFDRRPWECAYEVLLDGNSQGMVSDSSAARGLPSGPLASPDRVRVSVAIEASEEAAEGEGAREGEGGGEEA